MHNQPARHEFNAVIEGIDLSPEIVDRVARAVQKAVLTELADIDLQGSLRLRIPSPEGINNDGTQGIWVVSE
jgi:hypothetical protein